MDEIFLWKKTEIKQNFLSRAQRHRDWGVESERVVWKQLATFQTQIVQAKHQPCIGAWDVSGDSDTWPGSCHHFILAFKVQSFPCEGNSSVILAFFFSSISIHAIQGNSSWLFVVGNINGHFESVPARICCKFSLLLLPSVVLHCRNVNFLADISLILNYLWLPPGDIHSLE